MIEVLADEFEELPGKIFEYESPEKFIECWEKILGAKEAKKNTGIIYLWRSSVPVPRLKGNSDILYIGKSKNSISTRHYGCAKIEATGKRNRPRYEHILKIYGPISFHVAKFEKFSDELKKAEQKLLEEYFKVHLEYPPLNRMGK